MKLILGVDTSCDDTGVGLVDLQTGAVLANVVASQDAVHAAFGGVVPERASREHLTVIDAMFDRALEHADATRDDVHAVAATHGPGLVGALLVGLTWAKAFAWAHGVPFRAVHHLEGHVASAGPPEPGIPELCLVASGGHTSLFHIDERGVPSELGRTRDDAAGEAFDKVARLLGLPFPGGPALAELAATGTPHGIDLPTPLRGQEGFDFSFSGLKTAVAVQLERHPDLSHPNLAATFEKRVVDALVGTLSRAAEQFAIRHVVVVGGVAANARLRAALEATELTVRTPIPGLATDNGAMIALAAHHAWSRSGTLESPTDRDWSRDAAPYLPLDTALRAAS